MRLTCATWYCWAKDRIQEKTSHATWSRCASVWNVFVYFSKHSLLWDSPLSFILEGGHASHFFLCSLIGAHFFSMLLEHFFNDPSLLLQDYMKKISLDFGVFIFFDGWHVLCNSDVGVSMYMWVYVISIMEAWKDSTNGHNNLAKLNGSQASICRRFEHRYRHMALVGNMTIEEVALFYFQKEIDRYFTILWDRVDQHCRTMSY
jgi:hypothetical protein